MTPHDFLESFVQGNRWDCHAEPGDIRRAFNAAVSASHFADHYHKYNERHCPKLISEFPKFGAFIEHLSFQTGGAFKDIRSISNAYKHLYTGADKNLSTHSSISSSGSIYSIELPLSEDIIGLDEEAAREPEQAVTTLEVMFTRKDGSKSEFLPTLDTVVDFLGTLPFEIWGLRETS